MITIEELSQRQAELDQREQSLLAQLEALEQQKGGILAQINAIRGASQELGFWLAKFPSGSNFKIIGEDQEED